MFVPSLPLCPMSPLSIPANNRRFQEFCFGVVELSVPREPRISQRKQGASPGPLKTKPDEPLPSWPPVLTSSFCWSATSWEEPRFTCIQGVTLFLHPSLGEPCVCRLNGNQQVLATRLSTPLVASPSCSLDLTPWGRPRPVDTRQRTCWGNMDENGVEACLDMQTRRNAWDPAPGCCRILNIPTPFLSPKIFASPIRYIGIASLVLISPHRSARFFCSLAPCDEVKITCS